MRAIRRWAGFARHRFARLAIAACGFWLTLAAGSPARAVLPITNSDQELCEHPIIVVARWNEAITRKLLDGAVDKLKERGVADDDAQRGADRGQRGHEQGHIPYREPAPRGGRHRPPEASAGDDRAGDTIGFAALDIEQLRN